MHNSKDIITLTLNPCLDISAEIEQLAPTKKMRCFNHRIDPGGGGINVSRAITILGGSSTAIFPQGGSTGESVARLLEEQHVSFQPIDIDEVNRQSFAIHEQESNQQYRFSLPGPELKEETWKNCFEKIVKISPTPQFIVASGTLPPGVPKDFYGQLAAHFKNSSTRIVLDTSGESLQYALDAQVYLIKPNRRELEYICQCSLSENKDQEKKCREIVEQGGCEVLVLTLGKDGALLITKNEQFRVPGIEAEVVSAVGAGDSFLGAMIFALQQEEKLQDAFLYGIAAGTAALATEATILCHKDDTEDFYQQLQKEYGSA